MSAQDKAMQILLTPTAVSVSATGEVSNSYVPVAIPHYVRRFSVIPLVTGLNWDSLNVSLMIKSLASGSTASAICSITGVTGDLVIGRPIIKKGLSTLVNPGSRVYVNNNAIISGSPTIFAGIVVEPKWEEPENLTNVRVLT